MLVLCLSTGVFINYEGKFNGVLKLIVSLGTYVCLQKIHRNFKDYVTETFFKKLLFAEMFKTFPTVRESEKPIIVFSHLY